MRAAISLILVAIFLTSGCATVFNDKNRQMAIQSQTPGSEVTVDGVVVGVTPLRIGLTSRANLSNTKALFESRGGMPWAAFDSMIVVKSASGQQTICSPDSHVGIVWVVLDIFFGILPLVFDAITGQWIETNGSCNAL